MKKPQDGSNPEHQRKANILAAFALALTDKINEAMLANDDRSLSSITALIQIRFNPGISIDSLRRMIGLTHSSIVRVIDRLVLDGLVVRERSSGDTRVAVLNLTRQGEVEAQKMLEARAKVTEGLIQETMLNENIDMFTFIDNAIPSVVRPGADQDVVCRFCNMTVCPQERCPVNVCVVDS